MVNILTEAKKMSDFQYYPTPQNLVIKAWSLFQSKKITRVLEPSAGEGALLENWSLRSSKEKGRSIVDCVELDVTKHPLLQAKGYNVIGVDFLKMEGASLYSHIIMNPPFAEGVQHVLKAWDLLFDGELVAIVNAETIRNPYSKERQWLVETIRKYGSVEFLENAFMTPDTQRKTSVEVALVYLKKDAQFHKNFVSGLLDDDMSGAGLATGFHKPQEVAIPENEVATSVKIFNAAVKSMRDSVFAGARSSYYASLLGESMSTINNTGYQHGATSTNNRSLDDVRLAVQAGYDDLKNRAWTRILRATEVTSRLSAKGQQMLESQFESVKQLEFTEANIYGFLLGLVNSQSDINLEMALDVFDSITRYHSDNAVWYKGWKSNDKHITSARRIKTTRFIIPHFTDEGWRKTCSWSLSRFLADYDKVFAMLDGNNIINRDKENPFKGLQYAFENGDTFERLKSGERVQTEYFDVRFYPGVGTIHFFPRSKVLVDRLNRLVGRHRQWLPQENEDVSDAFWLQYENAEKYAKEVDKKLKTARVDSRHISYDMSNGREEAVRLRAIQNVNNAIDSVLTEKGINVDALLGCGTEKRLAA